MNLPIVAIITKIDLITEEERKELIHNFKSTLVDLKLNRVPIVMKNNDDIVLFSRNIQEKGVLPIFLVSNVMWDGLNLLKSFLSMLPVDDLKNELKLIENEKIEFDIHETLAIDEKVIVTGIVNKGKLMSGAKCYLGPDNEGRYKIVDIVNIHCKKIPVKYVYRGQYCSIYIKSDNGLKKEDIRKGMVLLDINSAPSSVRLFEAELWTIDGTTKIIKYKYQPILNIKHIRQGCKLRSVDDLFLLDEEVNCNETFDKILSTDSGDDLDNIKNKVEKVILENKLKKEKINCSGNLKKMLNNNCLNYNPEEAFFINSTSKTKVLFEFMFNPEYVTVGSHVIINDQLIKAYGIITKIHK